MRSSDGRKFSTTVILSLVLFGVGGALVDKWRNAGGGSEIAGSPSGEAVEAVVRSGGAVADGGSSTAGLSGPLENGDSEFVRQRPEFEAFDLKEDGTGTVTGKAVPGARVILNIDGKAVGMAEAGASGEFSLTLGQPLLNGAYTLSLKSVGPKGKEPVSADHTIKVKIATGRDAIVTLLEDGQAPLILAGETTGTDADPAPDPDMSTGAGRDGPQSLTETAQPSGPRQPDALAMLKSALAGSTNKAERPVSGAERSGDRNGAKDVAQGDVVSGEGDAADKAESTGETGNIWDKFSGIFKVDAKKTETKAPAAKQPPEEHRPEKHMAGNRNGESGQKVGREKGAAGFKMSAAPFAFVSATYRKGPKGSAIELAGSAAPGSRVRLFRGGQEIGEVVTDHKGEWSFVNRGELSRGTYLYRAGHVLKSGRIAAEARLQYDHMPPAGQKGVSNTDGKATRSATAGAGAGQQAMATEINPVTKTGQGDTALPRTTKRAQKSVRKRVVRKTPTRSRQYKRKKRKVRMARRSARKNKRVWRKNSPRRFYLGKKNRTRYLAKRRKLYPHSRKVPTRVRVVRGTTLWGYSEHYYGRGNLYPRIHRANRRLIRNPDRIFTGQRIRVPAAPRKRRKSR